jgi:hypothetical protein
MTSISLPQINKHMKYACILFCIFIYSCESFQVKPIKCSNKPTMNQVCKHKYVNLTESRVKRTKVGKFSNDFFHKFHFILDLIDC